MKAKKSNKSYTIEQREVEKFKSQGFDIYDDAGNLVSYGAGKTVSADKYLQLLKENEDLKEKLKLLENSDKKKNKEVK